MSYAWTENAWTSNAWVVGAWGDSPVSATYLINISGTLEGNQSLGYMVYSIGGNIRDTSVPIDLQQEAIDDLDNRNTNRFAENYLYHVTNQDIQNATGNNNGQQNLNNISYAFGKSVTRKDLVDDVQSSIASLTGAYQVRFRGYL